MAKRKAARKTSSKKPAPRKKKAGTLRKLFAWFRDSQMPQKPRKQRRGSSAGGSSGPYPIYYPWYGGGYGGGGGGGGAVGVLAQAVSSGAQGF